MPPLIQMVSSPVDTRNFDYFPFDDDIPPDELSGWDEVYRYIIKYCEYYLEVKHSRTIFSAGILSTLRNTGWRSLQQRKMLYTF